jgi:hypothetical protein
MTVTPEEAQTMQNSFNQPLQVPTSLIVHRNEVMQPEPKHLKA